MRIEELGNVDCSDGDGRGSEELGISGGKFGPLSAKRVAVGLGARILFYPTLLYNVVRNKMEPEFHWWDEVDKFLLLGAVPFPSDVPRLKQLGVCGVITLNESYETLVPTSLYFSYGIEHLEIPTRDYLFAPSMGDICQAVEFIHKNASCGKTTYVHCKAGRGRSTTVVLCYLVQHKQMTPAAAYQYVKMSRPRVLLASSQWQTVLEFYHLRVNKVLRPVYFTDCTNPQFLLSTTNFVTLDDSSFVVVSQSDLDGYELARTSSEANTIWAELNLVYRVQIVGRKTLARISCFWIRCHTRPATTLADNVGKERCSLGAEQMGNEHSCLLQGVVVNL